MRKARVLCTVILVPVISVLYTQGWLLLTTYISMMVVTVTTGFFLGARSSLNSGPKYQPATRKQVRITHILLKKIMERRNEWKPSERPVVISHKLDNILQEIINYITRDYILTWYRDLGSNTDKFESIIQRDCWNVISKLADRLRLTNWMTLLTQDTVDQLYEHFYNIRKSSIRPKDDGPMMSFLLQPYLLDSERELEFLRKTTDLLLLYLLPDQIKKAKLVRQLLREILACQVFQPTVDMLCDPDYINQWLYQYFVSQEQLLSEHKKTYTSAATYEDFIKLIEECDDIEHLKTIRYNIITEMMQAATTENQKKESGEEQDKEEKVGRNKGDLLRARDLKRYINQLRVTKQLCEKRIHILGGTDYESYDQETTSTESYGIPGRKVVLFSVIMQTPVAREYLMKYLHAMDREGLLGYWMAVENMKLSGKRHWHQMAAQIYQMYLTSAGSVVRTALDKATVKNMEAFMLGNKGPDAFHGAQDKVYRILEEKYYPSFIQSEVYYKYIKLTEEEREDVDTELKLSLKPTKVLSSPISDERRVSMSSTYISRKLIKLDDKIMNKMQALQALRQPKKLDHKMKKLQVELEKEIERLKQARRELEFYSERTDLWLFNTGHWRAQILQTQYEEEYGKRVAYFAIAVHKSGLSVTSQASGRLELSQGWVVTRKLEEFQQLHTTLSQINQELKKFSLPAVSRLKKSVDETFLEKAKPILQEFLYIVLLDQKLCHSEAVFNFFNQIPEHLKSADPDRQKVSSFSNFFKRFPSVSQPDSLDNELLFGDAEGSRDDSSRDSIAEPLYRLIGEVFELRGVFKYLRRSLIAFVQVTFGRTINRQISDTVDWVISEPMVVYYLRTLKNSMWPNGELAEPVPARSEQEKLEMRMLAKDKFLDNIPDALKNLLGDKATKQGAIKVFECLQEPKLNKNIFYSLLEIFLVHLLPELQEFIEHQEEEKAAQDKATADMSGVRSQTPKPGTSPQGTSRGTSPGTSPQRDGLGTSPSTSQQRTNIDINTEIT